MICRTVYTCLHSQNYVLDLCITNNMLLNDPHIYRDTKSILQNKSIAHITICIQEEHIARMHGTHNGAWYLLT